MAVYDSSQTWGAAHRGIQLFGSVRELKGVGAREAHNVYASRFPAFVEADIAGYRLYRLRPRRIKLFDERELGAGVFVTATVLRGRVAWERTDVYRATG